MLKYEKVWLIWGSILSIGCIILGLRFSELSRFSYVVSFIWASMTLCLNLLSISFVSTMQGYKEKGYHMIKVFIWAQAIQAMISFIYIYTYFFGQIHKFSDEVVWLQDQAVDIVALIYCILLYNFYYQRLRNNYFILASYLCVCTLCLLLPEMLSIKITFVIGSICFLLWLYMFLSKKHISRLMTQKPSGWIRAYFFLLCCQYGVITILEMTVEDCYIYQFIFAFSQSLILFISAYAYNIKEPWKEKRMAMDQVTMQLDNQQKNCETIVNLSHELKTPVNVIKSALTLLSIDYEQDEIMEEINANKLRCQEIMNIIQDMIDIQKIKTKLIQLHVEKYNLVELLENVVEAFALEKYPNRLIFDPAEEEIFSYVDGEGCQQAFMLLLGYLLKQGQDEKIFICIEENEEGYIMNHICSHAVGQFQWRKKYLEEGKDEEETLVADNLTVQLILSLITMANGDIVFNRDENSTEMTICIKQVIMGEEKWIDTENLQILREKIRCRYKIV